MGAARQVPAGADEDCTGLIAVSLGDDCRRAARGQTAASLPYGRKATLGSVDGDGLGHVSSLGKRGMRDYPFKPAGYTEPMTHTEKHLL